MTEKNINENSNSSSMKALPVFRGYTVDVRLRQFRKVSDGIEFLDFDSELGDELLGEYIDTLDRDSEEFRAITQYVFTRG